MSEPLENLYFNWLCAKIIDTTQSSPGLTYWTLFGMLHRTEFVWLISGDDNRALDGKELRREFLLAADIPDDPFWRTVIECSMLEMFIALCRRCSFRTDIPVKEWFWELMTNTGLNRYNDANVDEFEINDLLHQIIWRLYDEKGRGGIFPLTESEIDQRTVDLWYQFCEYAVLTGKVIE